MSLSCKVKFKNFEQMIKHTRRTGLKIRGESIHYFCNLLTNRSKFYEYFFESNSIKRINVDGTIKLCLKSKTNYVLAGYLFELEKFIDLGLEEKYENLENFYKEYGFGKIIKTRNESYILSTDLYVKG